MAEGQDRWAWNLVAHVLWVCSHSTNCGPETFNPYEQEKRLLPPGSAALLKPAGMKTVKRKAVKKADSEAN